MAERLFKQQGRIKHATLFYNENISKLTDKIINDNILVPILRYLHRVCNAPAMKNPSIHGGLQAREAAKRRMRKSRIS